MLPGHLTFTICNGKVFRRRRPMLCWAKTGKFPILFPYLSKLHTVFSLVESIPRAWWDWYSKEHDGDVEDARKGRGKLMDASFGIFSQFFCVSGVHDLLTVYVTDLGADPPASSPHTFSICALQKHESGPSWAQTA